MIDYHLKRERGRGGSFGIGRPRSRGWKNIGRSWTKRVGDLENWTILMDAICVSSLNMNPILVTIVMELIFCRCSCTNFLYFGCTCLRSPLAVIFTAVGRMFVMKRL